MKENDSGSYAILFHLKKPQKIQISKLGFVSFPEGYYVYSGNARKNLKKRIERHLRKTDKKLKWHIDFFINNRYVTNVDYWIFRNIDECAINSFFKENGGEIIIDKMGASDCKNHCNSHFLFLGIKYRISDSLIKKIGGFNERVYFLRCYK
jgi:sugar fermentation stimulation protein A